ncbi:amidohydrolase family protein [Anaerolactibacter massiliensis]|uniref:amidohydrolase family protein n=1 Tax=Anaerolactibacter massiliensis TaxID=2044573 RepID=UPI000CF89C07|nr:amidohydrolase family protein [Anaerolactibacter massiliensis]
MIIDFHAHLDRNPISKEYLVEEQFADMEKNHIDKRVISTFYGSDISAANDEIAKLVKSYPDQFIGCAVINPKLDDSVEEAERISGFSEFKVVEFDSLEHGYRPEKFQYNIDPILRICSRKHLIVKVFTGAGFYTMPDQWAYYSRRFPDITFVIEHLGGEDFRYGTVELVNEEPNLMMETSYETELPALHKIFSNISADRFLYGSNFPSNYTEISLLKFQYLGLDQETEDKLFFENAERLLALQENL